MHFGIRRMGRKRTRQAEIRKEHSWIRGRISVAIDSSVGIF